MHWLAALPSAPHPSPALPEFLCPGDGLSGRRVQGTCRKPQEPRPAPTEVAVIKDRPATDILQSVLFGAKTPGLCWEMEPLPLKSLPDSADAYL